jgi:hypothetical protein
MIDFYEANADKRDHFEIVAFHDGSAKTFEELDAKLVDIKKNAWGGRDLPFPVLLDATGETIKTFGIQAFPTLALIDPDGNVVQGGSLELLEEKLAELE